MRGFADDADGVLILLKITRRVLGVGRRFAEHVVGEGETAGLALAARSDRLLDRAAGDELLAHESHGDIDAAADDRLAAAGDEARQRRRQALLAGRRDQPAGQHQAPGGGVHEHRRAVAEMRAPVAGRKLVADQRVAGGGVGNAQQRLGEAHQRHPLLARERIFVDQALDAARARHGPQAGDEAAGQRLDAAGFVGIGGRHRDERRHAFGLRAPIGCRDLGPERRLRENLGAERGEDVGGVGHGQLPEANPRSRAAMSGGDRPILLSGRAFCLCREIGAGVSPHALPFAFPGADD